MRRLLSERQASVGVLAGLIGLFCLLLGSLALTLSYRTQLLDLKDTLADHCQERRVYYMAETRLREVQREQWTALAEQEQANPFIDDGLRQRRMAAYRAMVEAVDEAISSTPNRPCSDYLADQLEGLPAQR